MPLRAFLGLAILAASLGTPSVAFAAGNVLVPEAPDPATGTTETLFSFRVAYEGRSEALEVTLSVAGWSLPMSLVAGSPTSGSWSAATRLPAGTWTIGYTAIVAKGNAPSVAGGSVTVTQAQATSPDGASTEAIAPAPSATPQADPRPVADSAAPAPVAGSAAPAPVAAPTGRAEPLTAGGAGAPTPEHNPAPGGATSTPPGAVTQAGSPAAGSPTASVGAASNAAAVTHATAGGIPSAIGAGPDRRNPGTTLALILALAGLLGLLLVVLAVRRPRTASAIGLNGAPAENAPAHDTVTTVLERRALRRAKVRLDDDPIVASVISSRPARQRALRPPQASEVQRGPGVRERDR